MASDVVRVGREQLRQVQTVMDKAFADDPTVLWVSDLPEVFEAEHHRYVAMCADPAFDAGGVHATPGFEGAAIWYPPGVGVNDNTYEAFKATVRFPGKIAGLGELAEASDAFRPSGPHWTLELVAVDPNIQSKGIGSRLMRFGLDVCDAENLPVFLASSNPANLPFYERLGFVRAGEVDLPGKPPMYPMIRHPG